MSATEEILESFSRTTEEFITLAEFKRLLDSGRQLRIKYGVDVTAPTLHTGHAVNLWMMRELQDRGHKIQFLIGDFTTRIGDPSGRSRLRPVIPQEEIEANAQKFIEQVKMVIRFDDPALYEIRRNSEWYERMSASELIKLLSMVTHSRLIARDMFQARIKEGAEIYMHELIYPILQGYDSFMLQSDLTIIGSDQLYNEMMARFYQERLGQPPQIIITTRITPGIDGREKQSKSLGNYIGLAHSPRDKFGRVMSLPDDLIVTYLEVYTDVPLDEVRQITEKVTSDPMRWKLFLAHAIVRRYHGSEVADQEQRWFIETFSKRITPANIPEIALAPGEYRAFDVVKRFFGTQKSNSELRRLFEQGAIMLNGKRVERADQVLAIQDGDVFQVGKRTWFRIKSM